MCVRWVVEVVIWDWREDVEGVVAEVVGEIGVAGGDGVCCCCCWGNPLLLVLFPLLGLLGFRGGWGLGVARFSPGLPPPIVEEDEEDSSSIDALPKEFRPLGSLTPNPPLIPTPTTWLRAERSKRCITAPNLSRTFLRPSTLPTTPNSPSTYLYNTAAFSAGECG